MAPKLTWENKWGYDFQPDVQAMQQRIRRRYFRRRVMVASIFCAAWFTLGVFVGLRFA